MISKKVVNLPVEIYETRAEMGVASAKRAAEIINKAIAEKAKQMLYLQQLPLRTT